MNLGTILQFLITYAEPIFAVTFAIVLLLTGFLIYRNFFSAEGGTDHNATAADLDRIEESLRKILSQTGAGVGAAGGAAASNVSASGAPAAEGGAVSGAAAAGPAASGDEAQLRAEIENRAKQIEELKKQLESVKSQDNTPELLAKIKSLEDRLTEYEIIEDDIADLSIYKDENARLKKELEALKGGAPAATPAPPEASAAPVDAAPAAPEPAPVAPTVEPPSTPATQANLVEEFDAAVQNLEKQTAAPESAPAEVAPAPAPAAPAAPATTESSAESANADIFAELQGEPQSQDLLAELGEIDADRMLEEIKDLGEGLGDSGVLEESVDLDKLAAEADKKD